METLKISDKISRRQIAPPNFLQMNHIKSFCHPYLYLYPVSQTIQFFRPETTIRRSIRTNSRNVTTFQTSHPM